MRENIVYKFKVTARKCTTHQPTIQKPNLLLAEGLNLQECAIRAVECFDTAYDLHFSAWHGSGNERGHGSDRDSRSATDARIPIAQDSTHYQPHSTIAQRCHFDLIRVA